MTHPIEKIWEYWAFLWGQFFYISISDLKFVGKRDPTTKIIISRSFPILMC